MKTLLQQSLEPSSQRNYARAWALCEQFSREVRIQLDFPVTVPILALFVTWMSEKGYAPATIMSYVSALGYQHKLYDFPNPAAAFLIKRLLIATRKAQPDCDIRLPITHAILVKLLQQLMFATSSAFHHKLFRAMFLLAYHAFLRVGEMTASTHNLQVEQIVSMPQSVVITFRTFKHSQHPVTITVSARPGPYCPVQAMTAYLRVRGKSAGPLFQLDNKAVSRARFVSTLHQTVKLACLPSKRINSHSFRIGAATDAAVAGRSDAQIRSLGRWSSDAFKKYIRINDD